MAAPDCTRYAEVVRRASLAIDADRAVCDLRRYLESWRGGRFDLETERAATDEFTEKDFRALGRLNVGVLKSAREWLRNDGLEEIRDLLDRIPTDLDIWDVSPEEFCAQLGPSSPAWQLWHLLFDKQKGARRSGRGVTAGKLLHGKRPRLIPIYDRARIAKVLNVKHADFWEAVWCLLRNPLIRGRLEQVREQVSEASDLSLLRVLDVVLWMSLEPPCASVGARPEENPKAP